MKTIIAAMLLACASISQGQSYQDSLRKDDEDIISSIAPYPEDVRHSILNVSQYANKLVKIERIQSRTSQSFQDMISNYSREEQEHYYELARYPELVHQLVSGPPQSSQQIAPTLAPYPQEVKKAVNALFPMHLAELTSMDKTYQSSQSAMEKTIGDLPADAQADFKKIVAMPDVMNLLTERIDLVVSLGEAYKSNPAGTSQKLDSVSNQINAQNQKDLEDYKKQVANDPQMQEEMKKSAEDFADSYSANGDTAITADNQRPATVQSTAQPTVLNNYYYGSNYNPNPYAYWYGYPYWYDYPMWYPWPLYYHTGFYIGSGGAVVVIGLPSRVYSGWFFNYGYHRYPRYYNYCNTYYVRHQTFVNRVNVYQGFHSTVTNHFNVQRNVVRRDGNINRSFNRSWSGENRRPATTSNFTRQNGNTFRNSIRPQGQVNRQAFSNFHAAEFHRQNWGGGSGSRPSGGGGGGFRGNSGGGFRSGGGGGHGRR